MGEPDVCGHANLLGEASPPGVDENAACVTTPPPGTQGGSVQGCVGQWVAAGLRSHVFAEVNWRCEYRGTKSSVAAVAWPARFEVPNECYTARD